MGTEFRGRRIPEPKDLSFQPGDYWKDHNGDWMGCTPNGMLAGLAKHSVTEYEDQTITVSPSILVKSGRDGEPQWHGYLVRGIWAEC